MNVLAVDWSRHAATPWYQTAAQSTEAVGSHLAALLDHLANTQALRAADTHLVGFSLGAHVAGHAGKNLRSGRLRRITGERSVTSEIRTMVITSHLRTD